MSTQDFPAWKKKLPMTLTWLRMAIAPILVALLAKEEEPLFNYIAAALFIIASITDWFDGALARKYNAITNMGKFMDPIADKVLVSSVLVMLIPSGRLGPIMVIVLLVRDILIGGIRSVAAADGVIIDAKSTGKWKTGLQMVAIPAVLIYRPVFGIPLYHLGVALLWMSVAFSVLSGTQYTIAYYKTKNSKLAS